MLSRCASKSSCAFGTVSNSLTFRRSKHLHRQIKIQLRADVPGLGGPGTLHEVNPGRMRNDLFPKGLASYVVKGVAPFPVPDPSKPVGEAARTGAAPTFDFTKAKTTLATLPPLLIHRRVQPTDSSSSSRPRIFGSVTSHDLVQALQATHGFTLAAPNATVSILVGENEDGKVKTLGKYTANVALKEGGDVKFVFDVVAQELDLAAGAKDTQTVASL